MAALPEIVAARTRYARAASSGRPANSWPLPVRQVEHSAHGDRTAHTDRRRLAGDLPLRRQDVRGHVHARGDRAAAPDARHGAVPDGGRSEADRRRGRVVRARRHAPGQPCGADGRRHMGRGRRDPSTPGRDAPVWSAPCTTTSMRAASRSPRCTGRRVASTTTSATGRAPRCGSRRSTTRSTRMRDRFCPEPGAVRYLEGDEIAPTLPTIWDRFRLDAGGRGRPVDQRSRVLRRRRSRPSNDGFSAVAYLAHRDGYAAYRTKMEWNDGHPSPSVDADGAGAVTPEAHAALWSHAARPRSRRHDHVTGDRHRRSAAVPAREPAGAADHRPQRRGVAQRPRHPRLLRRAHVPSRRTGSSSRSTASAGRSTADPTAASCKAVRSRPDLVTSHGPVQLAAVRRCAAVGAGRRRPDAGPQRRRRSAAPTCSSRRRSRRTASPTTDRPPCHRSKVGGRWTTPTITPQEFDETRRRRRLERGPERASEPTSGRGRSRPRRCSCRTSPTRPRRMQHHPDIDVRYPDHVHRHASRPTPRVA